MSDESTAGDGIAGPEIGSFCWTEIGTTNAAKCMEFYESIFGWKFTTSGAGDGSFPYYEYTTGGEFPAGGMYEITPDMCQDGQAPPPPHYMTYVTVADVDAAAEKAVGLGATVVHGPMDIPNTGRFAYLQDPTGAMFAIFAMNGGQN